MKIPRKNKVKKQDINNKTVMKPSKEHVGIIAHEIKFARLLAGNEKKTRDRALKSLKKWLLNCFQKEYNFKENDFMRIWKGLFYAVWMSDKPLVQEELCENIASILDDFPVKQYQYALMMVKVGLQMMATEWYGIDHHRMDKCLMLVRRYLRGSLRCVARSGWSVEACKQYADMLSSNNGIMSVKTPLYARNATSMILHFIECYLEEIAKVSQGDIAPDSLVELLRPFCVYMCSGEQQSICASSRRLLTALVRQSEQGLTYQDKTRAWEKMGCPAGGPDALEEISDDEEDPTSDGDNDNVEETRPALDPRAGRVHVTLRALPVPAARLAALLTELRRRAAGPAYKRLLTTIQRFEALAKNEYPLKVEEVPLECGPKLPPPGQVAKSLASLEKQLIATSDELALRGLSRKHRKRLLAKRRSGASIMEDAAKLTHTEAAGDWQVEETVPTTNKNKEKNRSNKENIAKKRRANTNGDVTPKKIKTDQQQKNKNPTGESTKINKQKTINNTTETKSNDTKKATKIKATKSEPIKTAILKKHKTETILTPKRQPTIKPNVVSKKIKSFQKQVSPSEKNSSAHTPKKVKFVLKNNSMQGPVDYYKSVRESPSIPFDGKKAPSKTNLKPSTPSPINPFFKKKWKISQ